MKKKDCKAKWYCRWRGCSKVVTDFLELSVTFSWRDFPLCSEIHMLHCVGSIQNGRHFWAGCTTTTFILLRLTKPPFSRHDYASFLKSVGNYLQGIWSFFFSHGNSLRLEYTTLLRTTTTLLNKLCTNREKVTLVVSIQAFPFFHCGKNIYCKKEC